MSTIERLTPDRFSEPDPSLEQLSVEDAGPMLEALATETAQSIVAELGRNPATAAVIADRIGTSIQNVSHHLSQLEDAGLVTVAGTRYSEKGREMDVYAPAVTALVIGGDGSGGLDGDRSADGDDRSGGGG